MDFHCLLRLVSSALYHLSLVPDFSPFFDLFMSSYLAGKETRRNELQSSNVSVRKKSILSNVKTNRSSGRSILSPCLYMYSRILNLFKVGASCVGSSSATVIVWLFIEMLHRIPRHSTSSSYSSSIRYCFPSSVVWNSRVSVCNLMTKGLLARNQTRSNQQGIGGRTLGRCRASSSSAWKLRRYVSLLRRLSSEMLHTLACESL